MHNNKPVILNGVKIPYDLPETVLQTLLQDPQQKWAAFVALGYKTSAQSLAVLKQYAVSSDIYERIAAIDAIATHAQGYTLEDVLTKNLQHDVSLVIVHTCAAIAKLGLHSYHDAISLLLDHHEAQLQLAAMQAINCLWQETDLRKFIVIFQHDRHVSCRKAAGFVLMDHANVTNWAALFQIFSVDALPRSRVWACQLAYAYADKTYLPDLTKLLQDHNGHVRKQAARALAKINDTNSSVKF